MENQRIELWDTRTWRRVRTLKSDSGLEDGGTLAVSRDGRLVACGGEGFAELWDARTGRLRFKKDLRYGSVSCMAFSPDGRTLAAVGHKLWTMLWSTRNGRPRRTIDTGDWEFAIAYSPDGRRLVMGNHGGPLTWNTRNWREATAFSVSGGDTISQLLYSPDGRYLAAGVVNRWQIQEDKPAVIIWDAHSGRRLRRLDGQTLIPQDGFSRDSRYLMTTGPDRSVETWNTHTWRLDRSRSDSRPMNATAISPDGSFVAGTDDDTVDLLVTIWKRGTNR